MYIDYVTWGIWLLVFFVWILWAYSGWKEVKNLFKSKHADYKNSR